MSSRLRVFVIVAGVAVVAVGAVLGVTLATRQTPAQPHSLPGKPPLPRALATPASTRIEAAFRSWPRGSLAEMQTLGTDYPRDPLVQLYLGIALVWAGFDANAVAPLEAAKKLGRNTPVELQADNLLHPQYFPNYPVFEPLRPNPLLKRGALLQTAGHQQSAERLYLRAARAAPGDDEAQVAAAVGRFDKDNLSAAFSRLGPLTTRFPRSQTVRYYLGYLLAWTGQRDAAVAQFRKAVALEPGSLLGRSAEDFLSRIEKAGTSSSGR